MPGHPAQTPQARKTRAPALRESIQHLPHPSARAVSGTHLSRPYRRDTLNLQV